MRIAARRAGSNPRRSRSLSRTVLKGRTGDPQYGGAYQRYGPDNRYAEEGYPYGRLHRHGGIGRRRVGDFFRRALGGW